MIISYTECDEIHKWSQWRRIFPGQISQSGQVSPFCAYCGSRLTREGLNAPHMRGSAIHEIVVNACKHCGWWALSRRDAGLQRDFWYALIGCAKLYQEDSLSVPLKDLRAFLQTHPKEVYRVNPMRFEQLMADCLRVYFPEAEVLHVGKTGDKGIDIKLVLTESDTYLVQVKRRGNLGATEGVRAVRELNGVLFREGQSHAMLITSASQFSKAALEETRVRTRVKGTYRMVFLSYPEVEKLLRLPEPEPYEPWSVFYRMLDPTGQPVTSTEVRVIHYTRPDFRISLEKELSMARESWTQASLEFLTRGRLRHRIEVAVRSIEVPIEDGFPCHLALRPAGEDANCDYRLLDLLAEGAEGTFDRVRLVLERHRVSHEQRIYERIEQLDSLDGE